jgi:PPM family protein phosphatase
MLRVAEHFERSDTGRRRRANEDAFYARAPLFAVADGVGGAQAGEVASGIAVEVLQQGLPDDGGSVEERLRARVEEANARITELSRADDERAGMATTLTVAYVGEHELSVAHVGDSRLYRLREDRFERLTDDHSMVEELVRQGKITPEEADEHPQRSIITRALGREAGVQPDSHTWPARDGDVYLLCSDGLTSMVSEAEVAATVRETPSLEQAGRALIDAANAAGGRDNITVVLFRLEEVGPAASSGETTEHAAMAADGERPTARGPSAAAATASAPAPPEAGPAAVKRRLPRPPREGGRRTRAPGRRRRLRIPVGLVGALLLLAIVVLAGWYASQTVYFVGVGKDGFVTVYRGVPYELPAGVDLYSVNYASGVPVAELTPRQRRTVTDHQLRSHDDAQDYVRRLETGRVAR